MLRYRWRYAFGLVCLLITATMAMIIPYFLKRAVEVIEHDRTLGGLRFYILVIIGMALVQMFSPHRPSQLRRSFRLAFARWAYAVIRSRSPWVISYVARSE